MPLIQQLKNDWTHNGRDFTQPGFKALAFYRFGNWRMLIKPRLFSIPFSLFYNFLFIRARNKHGIELPKPQK
jgi:serine O-acetyltransferase